jgi:putative thioredoxin
MSDPDAWVVDVDARTFEKEVIERSRTLPVLIDFWAGWCGPCKELTPRLERRAREGAGRFRLAKIDVDANPELAQAFRVQGIPAVLAVVDGRLADGFQGALPDDELDSFLDRVAPGGPSRQEQIVEQAREKIAAGEPAAAIALLRDYLRQRPDDAPARTLLVDVLLDEDKVREAKLVFEKLSQEARETPEGKAVAGRIAFAESATDIGPLEAAVAAAPDDPAAHLELGRAYVAAKEYEKGLEELLAAVRLDPEGPEGGGEAKASMIEVFELLGLEDPLANDYRFKLSLELFT